MTYNLGDIPLTMKNIDSLPDFRLKIETWKRNNCSCWLNKVYIQNIGFIQKVNRFCFSHFYKVVVVAICLYVQFKKSDKYPWRSFTFKLVILQKVTLLHVLFYVFLNCKNVTKLRKAPHINIGCKSSCPWSDVEIKSIQRSKWLAL